MLGMEGAMPGAGDMGGDADTANAPAATDDAAGTPPAEEPKKKKFNPFDVVKDVVKDKLP